MAAAGERIRVLIADDHPSARRGLRALLSTCPAVEVVCEAVDGHEAVQRVEECRPDVVLMDIRMPVCDGVEATQAIKAQWPEVEVIVLTVSAAYEAAAIAAGADGFLLKGGPSQELLAALQCHGGKAIAGEDTAQAEPATGRRDRSRPQRLAVAVLTG
jgi:DNA-binding NarL/FixJ family response regulator